MSTLREKYNSFRDSCLKTTFQKFRHIGGLLPDGTKEDVESTFLDTFRKATWNLRVPVKFMQTVERTSTSSIITFKTPGTSLYHGLVESTYTQILPAITFKDNIQGKWCRNPLFNTIVEASLVFNGLQLQTITPFYCDHHLESLTTDRETTDLEIGNVSTLQEWSSNLPSFTASYTFPWYYCYNDPSLFPLYLCTSMDRLEHVFVVKNDISPLISLRKSRPFDISVPTTISELVDSDTVKYDSVTDVLTLPSLPLPTMHGNMIFMTDDEVDYLRCEKIHSKIMINDIKLYESSCDNEQGIYTVTFTDFDYPIHLLFWSLVKKNTLSKYHVDGKTPILHSTLISDGFPIFTELDSHLTERHYPGRRLIKAPRLPGYNSWSFHGRYEDVYTKSAVILNGSLSVKITPEELTNKSDYKLQVVAVYIKEAEITSHVANDIQREVKAKFTRIVIRGNK